MPMRFNLSYLRCRAYVFSVETALIEVPYHVCFVIKHVQWMSSLVPWFSVSDIGIWVGKEVSKRMLISVLYVCAFFARLYMSSPAKTRFVSSICTSRNETREDSHTQSGLVCINPLWAICSLVCCT